MNFQNILEYTAISYTAQYDYFIERLTELCSPNFNNGILALLMAAYLAFDYFKYMHSRKETDFYDSLPVRKRDWFKILLLCGISVFVILCTVTLGIELAIVFVSGYGNFTILQYMLWNLLCMIGIFLASFMTAVLAMTMTGHPIVAIMGYAVFASYMPIILRYLYPAFADTFFTTYVETETGNVMNFFSPASIAYKLTYTWGRIWDATEHMKYFIAVWIFAAVVGVIAYLLFLKRPSEAAGRAMSFEKANAPIRVLLVIPLALYIGLFLHSMSAFAHDAWLIFGVLFGGFIIHGLMECIFQFDVRALFSKKKQLLVSLLICYGVVFGFQMDFFNYDEYIPKADEVKTVYITSGNMQQYTGYGYNNSEKETDGITGEYIEPALEAAKDIMAFSTSVNWDADVVYTDVVIFQYELKNGQTKYRRYQYNVNDIPESFDKIIATKEYKNDICSLYTVDRSKINSIGYSTGVEYINLNLTNEQMNLLIDTYLEEYTALTYTRYYEESVILQFGCEYSQPKAENVDEKFYVEEATYYLDEYFPVYSSFKNTLSLLNEYGTTTFQETENLKVNSLEIYDKEYGTTMITTPELLDALMPYLLVSEFNHNKYDNNWLYGTLRATTDNKEIYLDICIKQSDFENIYK